MNKKAKSGIGSGSFLVILVVVILLFMSGGKIISIFNNPIALLIGLAITYALFK